jgi:hypothetical protein
LIRVGERNFTLRARGDAIDEHRPLEFAGREEAARFLRLCAREPAAREELLRFAHRAYPGTVAAAHDLDGRLDALATALARGAWTVTPLPAVTLSGVDGEPEPISYAEPVKIEVKAWDGVVRTEEAPRWDAVVTIEVPPRWRGRIIIEES